MIARDIIIPTGKFTALHARSTTEKAEEKS